MAVLRPKMLVKPLALTLGLLLLTGGVAAGAQEVLSPRAQGYAQFELGKWAELQAGANPSSADLAPALKHYRAALAADPQSIYLTGQVAELLASSGQSTAAMAMAEALVQQHPADLQAHRLLGDIYLSTLEQSPQPAAGAGEAQLLAKAVAEYQTLVGMDRSNADEHVVLGKLYGASGDAAGAEREFRTALNLNPADSDALATLVQTLARQGDLEAAAAAIEAEPPPARTGRVYATLGGAYFGVHRYGDAAAAFQKAVQARPDIPEFQNDLAQALMQNDDYAGALAAFQRLAQQVPTDGRTALRVAQMQMQMGQFAAASTSLDTAGRLLPAGDIEVGYARALLDQSEGKEQAALAALKTLAARPNNARTESIFLDQLGRLQMRTADYTGAEASFERLSQLGGEHTARAQALELELFRQERNYPQALAVMRKQMAAAPDSRALKLSYASLQADAGDVAGALATLKPLLHGGPDADAGDAAVYLAMGEAEMGARRWSQARDDTNRAQGLASTAAARAQAAAQLGAIASRQHHYDDAERQLELALSLDPANPNILNSLGYVLAQQNSRLVDALAYAQQSLRQDADNPAYLDTLGWIYFKMKRWPEAVHNLQRAAQLDPRDPDILNHLGQAYAEQGQWGPAASSWTQALTDVQRLPAPAQEPHLGSEIEKNLAQARKRLKN